MKYVVNTLLDHSGYERPRERIILKNNEGIIEKAGIAQFFLHFPKHISNFQDILILLLVNALNL